MIQNIAQINRFIRKWILWERVPQQKDKQDRSERKKFRKASSDTNRETEGWATSIYLFVICKIIIILRM